tara:strand:+ start:7115 stop:7222 length:108 start_codon:yes stop_codon:yes gene_type:complete
MLETRRFKAESRARRTLLEARLKIQIEYRDGIRFE